MRLKFALPKINDNMVRKVIYKAFDIIIDSIDEKDADIIVNTPISESLAYMNDRIDDAIFDSIELYYPSIYNILIGENKDDHLTRLDIINDLINPAHERIIESLEEQFHESFNNKVKINDKAS